MFAHCRRQEGDVGDVEPASSRREVSRYEEALGCGVRVGSDGGLDAGDGRGQVARLIPCKWDRSAWVDRYEASVWHIPRSNSALLTQVMKGTATFAKLAAAGALQMSPAPTCNPSYPDSFPWTGSWSEPLYAVSVAGVRPTTCTTWYQAEQACRLAGKRFITNQEWQAAVAGTPDPPAADDGSTECNTMTAGGPVASGSRSKCVSSWGGRST